MNSLELRGISKSFGGVRVLHNVNVKAEEGKLTALIGPNGAGKSTLANIASGLISADEGSIHLGGVDVTKKPAFKRARLGLSRTFQNLELFEGMTVHENTVLGAFGQMRGNAWKSPLTTTIGNRTASVVATDALERMSVSHLSRRPVDEIGFGEAKLVEPARLLAAQPRALVMDEPAAGLAWQGAQALGQWMRELAESGVAVLLIEHNMPLVMKIADHVVVLNYGELIAEGPPEEIRANPLVREAYLGHEQAS